MELVQALSASPVDMAEAEVCGAFSWVIDGSAEPGIYYVTAGVLNMPHTLMYKGDIAQVLNYARERGLPIAWIPVQEGED